MTATERRATARGRLASAAGVRNTPARTPPALAVTALGRDGDTVRLTLAVPGAQDLVVLVAPRDGSPAWGVTRHLALRYEGAALAPAQERALRLLALRLRDVPFRTLADNAPDAPGSASSSTGPDVPFDPETAQDVVTVDTWGNPDRWRTFLFRREFQRNASSAIRLAGRNVVEVSHGESECEYATPRIDGRTMSLYNYPWVRPLEEGPRPASDGSREARRLPSHVLTDLRDAHIITGGTARLEAVLDALAPRTTRDDLVLVKSTCVPRVIGDDMEGAVARWRGLGEIRYDDVFATEPTGVVSELMARAIASGARKRSKGVGASLAGLAAGRPFEELVGLLRDAGIAVRSALLPDVDLRVAAAWRTSTVQVLVPNPYFRKYYEQVFAPLGMATATPPAPYGVAGTRTWLEAVARACGRFSAMRRAWRAAEARIAPALARLRREIAGLRLGFVVGPGEVAALFDPLEMAGVPALDVAVELGFGIDLLVFEEPVTAADRSARFPARRAARGGPQAEACGSDVGPSIPPQLAGAVAVYRFGDRAALDALLRSAPCAAIYSDLYADERVLAAGKAPFSLQLFEPGLEGALRTGERLLGACRLPFFRKYGGT
ncbi:MAG: hypothetical protein HY907_22625 [Deltaproteobacteria bacterium]|nr:hypothetical protein [Deltaproteobacteria bacterium]